MRVPCDTLDSILAKAGVARVDFVRIQVNGAEQEVLAGMEKTLAGNPNLLIAAIYKREGKPSWQRVVEILQAKGYTTQVAGHGNVFAWKDSQTPKSIL